MQFSNPKIQDGTEWGVMEAEDGSDDIHIVPLVDTEMHDVTVHCACCPEYDEEENEWVHNCFDGREAFERGFRKVS